MSDVHATVADLVALAPASMPVLELGVGTGRLALPLAAAGVDVVGIDASEAMLERLRAKDPDGRVRLVHGDMAAELPDGPFGLVFVAYNTLFNLTDPADQDACIGAVARRLAPGGRFVVEAFVPGDDDTGRHDAVTVRDLRSDRVVLSVSVHDADARTLEGQFVEFTESGGVRLRPWAVRYRTPAELDEVCRTHGLELEHRWSAFGVHTFPDGADRHVSVYRTA